MKTNVAGVEPMNTRFLTPADLKHISDFSNDIHDKSISTKILDPIASFIAYRFVPPTLAPNVLTLCAMVCVLVGYYYTYMYHEVFPKFTSFISIIFLIAYVVLDAIDGKHAKAIQNESQLGFFFNQAADNVSITFIMITVLLNCGVSDMEVLWYAVQMGNFVFLWSQLSALKKGYITYGLFTGPGEALFLFVLLLIMSFVFGAKLFINFGRLILFWYPADYLPLVDLKLVIYSLYYILFFTITIKVLFLPSAPSRNVLLLSLYVRSVPSLLYVLLPHSISMEDVVCDGLFMSIIISDVVLSRMSKRGIHFWLVIMALSSLLNKIAIVGCVVFYYIGNLYDIATYLNLPLFTVVVNVYIDGVFDLCHLGHKNHINRALEYGNRLFVGVMSDEDVANYKREPIMTTEERVAEVEALRYVYKVIPKAPCFGLTKEFIRKYNIHRVLCSPEYDYPEEKCYRVPRDLGILEVMPRTEGVSTSDIIKRIKDKHLDS